MREETERGRVCGRIRANTHDTLWPYPGNGANRNRRALAIAVGAALMFVPTAASGNSAPCAQHTDTTAVTRSECLAVYHRQAKRDHMAWPPSPTVAEVRKRVDRIGGPGTYAKAWRVARCETGANPRHYPDGQFIGMLGMARSTYAYGAHVTGYPFPATATPQQQIAVAVASFPITRAWAGWGCGGA